MSQVVGIAESTFNVYKKNKRFAESLKEGKEVADSNVEKALYERACGYSHPEEKIFQYEGKVVRANTVKQYAPDTTACIFWLKNRKKYEWRDNQNQVSINNNVTIENNQTRKDSEADFTGRMRDFVEQHRN